MFASAVTEIVTDASGNATVYLTLGTNRKPNGFLVSLKYIPGTIDTGADLTITGENSGVPILTQANAGTGTLFLYPRALSHAVADGTASSSGSEYIPLKDDRIKVVVAQGGSTKTGSIEALIMTHSPY